jgi:hypothetical protein
VLCTKKSGTNAKNAVASTKIEDMLSSETITKINFGEPSCGEVPLCRILLKFNGLTRMWYEGRKPHRKMPLTHAFTNGVAVQIVDY